MSYQPELTLKDAERVLTRRRRKYVKVTQPPTNPNNPRVLDLFCGAGGASWGYYKAGLTPVGVDIDPQPNYPFEFWQQDALDVLREEGVNRKDGKGVVALDLAQFDVIHASPPCQLWSAATPESHRLNWPDLITPLRPLLQASGLPYVIENVPGAPLIAPIMLCGSSFGLPIRRHRLFESNVKLHPLPCVHAWQLPHFEQRNRPAKVHLVGGAGPADAAKVWNAALGIDPMHNMTRYEVAEAIPPAYTHFIGAQLRAYILNRRYYEEVEAHPITLERG